MTDEFKRYLAMRNLIRGKASPEDIKALTESERNRLERYGDEEVLQKAEGSRMQLNYRGETRDYFYTSDGIWLRGRDILVEKAYRVFGEDEKTVIVRQVQEPSEIEAIVHGCREKIRRMLG